MKRLLAFLTAGALCCCLMASAFAEATPEAAETPEAPETMEARAVYAAPAPKPAGADEEPEPDPEGTLSFENLDRRIRENNLTVKSLDAAIAAIDTMDEDYYERMMDTLLPQLNKLAEAQWTMISHGLEGTKDYQTLASQYDALEKTFDDLKDGKVQEDAAAAKRQLENAKDQLVVGAESLYAALLEMRVQRRGLQRQSDALDRTVQEMELRHNLGQMSALQLQEVKNGRAALRSGIATLDMNIRNYTLQLEAWIGAEQAGELALYELPEVAGRQLEAMDLEKDLKAAKEISYPIFSAGQDLKKAKEDFKSSTMGADYAGKMLQSARYTYDNAVQSFELNFRTMFARVGDCKQILEAKETALALEQSSFQAQSLKYKQGTISKNAYLTAREELAAAEDAVLTAKHDLFTAYRTYYWAMTYGVLN